MLLKHWKAAALLTVSVASHVDAGFLNFDWLAERSNDGASNKAPNKDQFIDSLVSKMSVSDLGELISANVSSEAMNIDIY